MIEPLLGELIEISFTIAAESLLPAFRRLHSCAIAISSGLVDDIRF